MTFPLGRSGFSMSTAGAAPWTTSTQAASYMYPEPARDGAPAPINNVERKSDALQHSISSMLALEDAQHHAREQMAALKEAAMQAQTESGRDQRAITLSSRQPDEAERALRRAQEALARASRHAEQHRTALAQAHRDTQLVVQVDAIRRVRDAGRRLDSALRSAAAQRSPEQVASVLQNALGDAEQQCRALCAPRDRRSPIFKTG